ncbi:hypothetical protein M378DRAFT_654729 [Amanita muscaria Koide BX008]|uniref:tRNA-guanine(15) transglycosylase-like domain-containing protein n=1 Tax=Amanita muscaria (strain Koide BX008) TaxID=946122 RepID=A0A0C2X4Q9_AMAMK|nr:hypothetical protein M378DRAFT_654729 [Amanita muscaria Koide BX008]
MTIRDPSDGRDMPPNGNNHISACCLRGVRKINATEWRSYVLACQPDVVVALSDIPFTKPPYSQKRLTKAIDRTIRWLADMLRPIPLTDGVSDRPVYRPNVLVHMAGGTSMLARRVFSDSLSEKLHGKEAEQVAPLRCLDEGVIGYTFDLVPLRLSFRADTRKVADDGGPSDNQESSANSPPAWESVLEDATSSVSTEQLLPFIHASLEPLPTSKLRIVNTAASPHEMLRLIQSAGIDLFDAHFAQRAAQIGIALDFAFPAPHGLSHAYTAAVLRRRDNGKLDIGHNLYDSRYSLDFSCFASCFSPASNLSSTSTSEAPPLICSCLACSPVSPGTRICHSSPNLEAELEPESSTEAYRPPHTRAYIHHLLHTHEMSAHSLLVMHNLTILDAFFAGVRKTIAASDTGNDVFGREVERFVARYDEDMVIFQEASVNWRDVDLVRGKGRLERERKKQALMDGSALVEDE